MALGDVLKKIAKAALIGGGTVLSLVNPALGAPLVVAGTAIKTEKSTASTDVVATSAANLNSGIQAAAAMQQTGSAALATSSITNWITANLPIIGLALIGLLLLPKLFKK